MRRGNNDYLNRAGKQNGLDDAVGSHATLKEVSEVLGKAVPFNEENAVLPLIHLGEKEGAGQHGNANSTQQYS